MTVIKITGSTALFKWKHEAKNNIHDIKFKLTCAGMRQYVDLSDKIIQEKDDFQHLSDSTSKDMEILLADNLEANTKYICKMSSLSGNIESPPSQQISFKTLPGSKQDSVNSLIYLIFYYFYSSFNSPNTNTLSKPREYIYSQPFTD